MRIYHETRGMVYSANGSLAWHTPAEAKLCPRGAACRVAEYDTVEEAIESLMRWWFDTKVPPGIVADLAEGVSFK